MVCPFDIKATCAIAKKNKMTKKMLKSWETI